MSKSSYKLVMVVRDCEGVVSEIKHVRDTERECDEEQLKELARMEHMNMQLVSACVVKERAKGR